MSLMTENMITPTSGWRSRISRSASSPPIPGICTSSSTRSTAVVRILASPSSPEEAMTAFMPPFSMMKWAFWRMVASSSTMRMVGIAHPRLYHPSNPDQEKECDQPRPEQGFAHGGLEPPEEMDARQPPRHVDQPVQALPVAEAEALLPSLGGGDGEREEK